ncbi:MAG: prephenate dehydrogenase [candidate division Zixibacteria bacterium]|nr:prephenate dehydrogenase [candidate division Zixibacteria bacterium]
MNLINLKVCIVGMGQIGGSIARVLTEKNLVSDVIGYDIDKSITSLAEECGYIDNSAESISKGISKADIIFLATPIRKTIKLLPEIIEQIKSNQIVIDVAGIQSGILEIVSRQSNQINYISGHPIAGNEKIGIKAASSDKFNNALFFLTPTVSTIKEWIDTIVDLIKSIGAKPIIIDPQKHDFLIGLTINLPYLLSLALMNLASNQEDSIKDIWQLSGGSFKGATRVASSSPELTLDMFMTNRGNILNILKQFQSELSTITELLSNKDETGLSKRIVQAKAQKEYIEQVQNG